MKKDFEKWHVKKSNIDNLDRPFFHEREIWFCYLGANVGFEQNGDREEFLRPVVVIKKFNNQIFWGIPLSKSDKPLNKKIEPYYFDFCFIEPIKSRAIISQIRLIDARRLATFKGHISEDDFQNLMKKLKALIP